MIVTCPKCGTAYDDAGRWTICPHTPLGYPVDDLCPECDTLKSVHGPCRHQQSKPEISGNDVADEIEYPKVCRRCEGDWKAHGSDRPFESSGTGDYPGSCPMCHGTGVEPDAKDAAREQAVRRACKLMGWDYHASPVWTGLRKVAIAEAVAISLEKLNEMLDKIELLQEQVNAVVDSCYYRTAAGKVHWKQGKWFGTSEADHTDAKAYEEAIRNIRWNAGIAEKP